MKYQNCVKTDMKHSINMDMFYRWVRRKFARIGEDGNDVRPTPSPLPPGRTRTQMVV